MITSAQEATRSVWCAAESCGNEAESGSRLCWRCIRKDSVRIHTTPPSAGATLPCKNCRTFKPDHEFCSNKHNAYRRGRHDECRACQRLRRKSRKPLTPEQRQRAIERNRSYRARDRAALQALMRGDACASTSAPTDPTGSAS